MDSFAKAQDYRLIGLFLVAERIYKDYLNTLVAKAEDLINRKMRLLTIKTNEGQVFVNN